MQQNCQMVHMRMSWPMMNVMVWRVPTRKGHLCENSLLRAELIEFRVHLIDFAPYLLYVNPIQSVCRLAMPTLSSSNHCPNAWHKFWLSDRVVCVWCASECVQLVPNYSLPARGWCRMLLSVHPEREGGKFLKGERRGNFSNSILEYAVKVRKLMENCHCRLKRILMEKVEKSWSFSRIFWHSSMMMWKTWKFSSKLWRIFKV